MPTPFIFQSKQISVLAMFPRCGYPALRRFFRKKISVLLSAAAC